MNPLSHLKVCDETLLFNVVISILLRNGRDSYILNRIHEVLLLQLGFRPIAVLVVHFEPLNLLSLEK